MNCETQLITTIPTNPKSSRKSSKGARKFDQVLLQHSTTLEIRRSLLMGDRKSVDEYISNQKLYQETHLLTGKHNDKVLFVAKIVGKSDSYDWGERLAELEGDFELSIKDFAGKTPMSFSLAYLKCIQYIFSNLAGKRILSSFEEDQEIEEDIRLALGFEKVENDCLPSLAQESKYYLVLELFKFTKFTLSMMGLDISLPNRK